MKFTNNGFQELFGNSNSTTETINKEQLRDIGTTRKIILTSEKELKLLECIRKLRLENLILTEYIEGKRSEERMGLKNLTFI